MKKENLLSYVNTYDNDKKITDSISLTKEGQLEQNLDIYDELDSEIIGVPLLVIDVNAFNDMDLNYDMTHVDRSVPVSHKRGAFHILTYADYTASHFYGHKIIMVNHVKVTVDSNGEVKAKLDEHVEFNPIKFMPEHHGMRLNEIIFKGLYIEGGNNVEIFSTVITNYNSSTTPFMFMTVLEMVEELEGEVLRVDDFKERVEVQHTLVQSYAIIELFDSAIDNSRNVPEIVIE